MGKNEVENHLVLLTSSILCFLNASWFRFVLLRSFLRWCLTSDFDGFEWWDGLDLFF